MIPCLIKSSTLWIAYYKIVKETKLGSEMFWNKSFMCNTSFDVEVDLCPNERRVHCRTQLCSYAIGLRRCPHPDEKVWRICHSTPIQRNWDGLKGLYHLSAVEAVTQG